MLQELKINNFAVIKELNVDFDEGLNIISGETGSGKSVIITALELVLGAKSSSEYIRTGADQLTVEASFILSNPARKKFSSCGINIDEDSKLILKRRLNRQGKSSCYANDSLISLSTLTQIGQELVDIHGQHQHQLLLKSENHLLFLDDFAGLGKKRENLEELFFQWQSVKKQERQLISQREQFSQRLELLTFQAQEIDQANLLETEEDALKNERNRLLNAGKIMEDGQWAYQALYEAQGSVSEILGQVKTRLKGLIKLDKDINPLAEAADTISYQINDLASSLNDYTAKCEYDPARFGEIEERLDLINKLKKYGSDIPKILQYREKIALELNTLTNSGQDLESLVKQGKELEEDLTKKASVLSQKRKEAAGTLEETMGRKLVELGMLQAEFLINFNPVVLENSGYAGNAQGFENIEFLFSANPGESPKPLVKVASGGELSRIMLALKSLLGNVDRAVTLVFDEVDVGIGGKIAEVVGKKLRESADHYQVICITHLPQIAALAQHHFMVSKKVSQGETIADIACLSMPERINEVARMLAGVEITPSALEHARSMIENC